MIFVLWACAPDLSAPVPVAWDHAACDHCGMLISDPRFAAQLVTRDGERREYDDPACLFRDIAQDHPSLGNVWFHDSAGDGWLPWSGVAFVPASGAPMDGGLAAVVPAPGALSFGEASARVLGGGR